MRSEASARVEQLEAAISKTPDSLSLRQEILSAYCAEPALVADPRRLQHILWLVRHHPEDRLAHCPFAYLEDDAAAEDVGAVEREWQRHVDARPADGTMLRGLACFLANHGGGKRALELLHEFVRVHGGDARLWLDIGRIEPDAARRLEAFRQARAHQCDSPNLVPWIATTAFEAGELAQAEAASCELLSTAAATRAAYGDAVNWLERGGAFWERARNATSSDEEAGALVDACKQYAECKHWGHTVAGLLAERAGDIDSAVQHLQQSAVVGGSPRLRSYGPSMWLADVLCAHARWDAVADYLEACGRFWDNEALTEYLADVRAQRVPDW